MEAHRSKSEGGKQMNKKATHLEVVDTEPQATSGRAWSDPCERGAEVLKNDQQTAGRLAPPGRLLQLSNKLADGATINFGFDEL